MSKKRFTEGLESLFGEQEPTGAEEQGKTAEVEEQPEAEHKESGKNFMSDLEAFFADSLHESIRETEPSSAPGDEPPITGSGLDSLIRSTIETSEMEVNYAARKRVTFTFEKGKLEKLKRIAKLEKSYMRDIIGQLLSEYIEDYESKKGDL